MKTLGNALHSSTMSEDKLNKAVAMKGLTLSLLHLPFAFAFCISNLNFLPKFGIFPIHIFEFPAKNLDSIGVVGGGGVHGDNRGTSSFGHSALLGSHENFKFGQKFWVWAKNLGSGEIFGFGRKF